MPNIILQTNKAVTLVGGGVCSSQDLEESLGFAPIAVGVDGGAEVLLKNAIAADAVIGDFDSISPQFLAQIPPQKRHHISEQESTDFDKALRSVDAPLFIGVGFGGARLDHQLAALHVLAKYKTKSCILLIEDQIICHMPPLLSLPLERNDVVSLFPLGPVRGRSLGLQWPIDGISFSPMTQIGTSNTATGPIEIQVDQVGLIGIFPRYALGALSEALCDEQRQKWP